MSRINVGPLSIYDSDLRQMIADKISKKYLDLTDVEIHKYANLAVSEIHKKRNTLGNSFLSQALAKYGEGIIDGLIDSDKEKGLAKKLAS